jgi:hypothetical protein
MLAVCLALIGAVAHAADDASATEAARVMRADLARQLTTRFDVLLAAGNYHQVADQQCRMFPEGKLFPYSLPAMAYCSLAAEEPDRKPQHLKQAATLIDLAIRNTAAELHAPRGDLLNLPDYRRQGTWVGQLNLTLSMWRSAAGDDRYTKLNDHLTDLLVAAMTPRGGAPIESYPQYSWSFDTAPVLLSIRLHDHLTGRRRADALVRDHVTWLKAHGTDPATGLPLSQIRNGQQAVRHPPRGCGLSWRIAMLAQLDADYARQLYAAYVKHFWLQRELIAGFAEWPGGRGGTDVDSGPILMGVGASTAALGISATAALGDDARLMRLLGMVRNMPMMLPMVMRVDPGTGRAMLPGGLPYDAESITGLFYGDATLFAMVTWRDWTTAKNAE